MRASVARDVERRLVRPAEAAGFSDAELDGLPRPGLPLPAGVDRSGRGAGYRSPTGRGRIKLGRWIPFRGEELLAPHLGFHWSARAAGVVGGFDRYADGEGRMRWKLLGALPVMTASGPDLSRSAAKGCSNAGATPTGPAPSASTGAGRGDRVCDLRRGVGAERRPGRLVLRHRPLAGGRVLPLSAHCAGARHPAWDLNGAAAARGIRPHPCPPVEPTSSQVIW